MENIVSEFLVSTCRMHTKFDVKSRSNFLLIPLENIRYFGPSFTQIVCGSQAEFYIQPINSCIDDLDILYTESAHFAFNSSGCEIPEGTGDLCDLIICSKLESHEQNKSFVRLRDPIVGLYDWNLEDYRFLNKPLTSFMQRDFNPTDIIGMLGDTTMLSSINGKVTELNEEVLKLFTPTGPALKNIFPKRFSCKRDLVSSVRCPSWPHVAEEWPKRTRFSGWPNSATISTVVLEGCDVVPVTHRDMHEDVNQWRLSFSRAEVILIKSWTSTQQIVYHLLRFFAKREIIPKNCPKAEEVVCTYHLKTLMLWSCEEESIEWWETFSVVALCCNLCGRLSECLKRKHCPNYFIPEANLLDHELNIEILQQTIETVDDFNDVDKMSQWFVMHYILPVYQKLRKEDESLLTEEMVERCIVSVCEYNEKRQLNDLNIVIRLCAFRCCWALESSYNLHWTDKHIVKMADSEMPLKWFIDTTAVSKMHNTLADYMKALILFQMSQCVRSSKLQCDVDLLSEIWIHIVRQSYFVEKSNYMQPLSVFEESMLYFNRAEQIMKHLVFGYSKNESCLAIMVSMLCLHKSLCCDDLYSSKTETASRIYLAALYYYIGHLQSTVHLCSQVESSFKDKHRCRDVRNLKVNSLLFIDDLATIAGFLLLRRNILPIRNKSIYFMSPELFAYYLFVQCSPERLKITETFGMALSFEADCCLAAVMRYKILRRFDSKIPEILIYSRCTEDAEDSATRMLLPGNTDIAEALVRISNDYITRFYAALSEEFGSKFNLASCYEALSLYLCRKYEEIISLCEKLLEEPEDDSDLEEFEYLNVNVSLYFIEYFDEDIQALVGFQLLVLRLTSLQHDIFENILDDDSKWMRRLQFVDRHSQSYSAYVTYYEIFNPILRRQFLGNYLKLRCLQDLGFPLLKVISAFRCVESRSLFEQTVMHFMRQKIMRSYMQ